MRAILFMVILLNLTGCATTQTRWEWAVDAKDSAKIAQANADDKECKDFAYRSKVAGSRYTELDIHISCMQRRGYKLREVAL